MNPEKDYLRFSRQLVEFSNEMRYEARRGGGDHMDVDTFARDAEEPAGDEYYSEDQWDAYKDHCEQRRTELTEELNWMGKGKGKGDGGKSGKGKGKDGKGKGGSSGNCLWCEKPGHYKKDCLAFAKWKDDKDEERKKNGQSPYVAPVRNGPRAPLKSLEQDYTSYDAPLGGMTAGDDVDAVSLEAEVLCGACSRLSLIHISEPTRLV